VNASALAGHTSRVRKQYTFWPGERGLDAWDIDRLIELSRDLPVIEVPLGSIGEIDSAYCFWATAKSRQSAALPSTAC
jgi:hypothetical protein